MCPVRTKSAKVTKALLPHHSVPRLGSACPQSGIAPWARRDRPSLAVSRLPRHPCRGAHCAMPACGQRGLTGRLRSRSKAEQQQSQSAKLHSPVGAGLSGRRIAAMAVHQPIHLSTDTPSSQASQLPQLVCGVCKVLCPAEIPCGSGLARDGGGSCKDVLTGLPLSQRCGDPTSQLPPVDRRCWE